MAKRNVLIRVDGNSTIGLGHIYRGIALAEMLDSEYEIFFVVKPDTTIEPIRDAGFNFRYLPDDIAYLDEPEWFNYNIKKETIIVCDGYEFKSEYQKRIKEYGFKLIYVDDLAQWHMYADVVINHSPGAKEIDYKTEIYTKLALGLNYAMLRKPFLEEQVLKAKHNKGAVNNVLVSFGGADKEDFTFKAVKRLIEINSIKRVNVILGNAYLHNHIYKFESEKLRIYKNLKADEMVQVMRSSDIAIVPASTVSIELAVLGVPMILGYFVDNQKGIYEGLIEQNMAVGIGDFYNFNFCKLSFDNEAFLKENNSVFKGNGISKVNVINIIRNV